MASTDGPAKPRKGFGRYEPGCEEAIYEFQRACYPERPAESILPRWKWLFLDSAERLGLAPPVWMYWKGGRVVAHQGALPIRLQAGGETLTTGWFIETMAAEEVRGSPIGSMLVQKALGDMPLNLSLGQTEQMRELQYALGWRDVAPLNTYVFVCGYDVNLRGKLPPVAAESAAFLLGARHAWRLRRHRGARERLRARRIAGFDARHDALWDAMASTVHCATVRDAAYLNWKYVDRPGADFILLEVSEGERVVAVCVLMVVPPDAGYPYPRGFIVDLVAALDDPRRIDGVLAHAIAALQAAGARTATFYLAHPALERHLLAFGFIPRGARHRLLVSAGDADADSVRTLLDAGNWFVTMGDSDADAYPG